MTDDKPNHCFVSTPSWELLKLPSIHSQPLKLTDLSCVKDAKLERLPVVVEQECISVYMENFPGTFSCCLGASHLLIWPYARF